MSKLNFSLKSALMLSSAGLCLGIAHAQEAAEPADGQDTRTLETVVVRGLFIPDEKRSTSEISSLIDAEDFQLTGDSNAASALGRVTGLSLSDGKFIFVRGLNERYTNATLNGLTLPSPEPLRRVAPLDLFPTSVLETILVQKTHSPEFSSEFGGGLLELRTKSVPDQGFFEIGASISANTATAFQDGLLFDGGDTDFLGFDDGTRNIPDVLAPSFNNTPVGSLDLDTNIAIAEALTNPQLQVIQQGVVGPNVSFSTAGGQSFDVTNDIRIGVIGTASYGNQWDTKQGVRATVESAISAPAGFDPAVDGALNIGTPGAEVDLSFEDNFSRFSTENLVTLNGLGSIGAEFYDTHEVAFTTLVARSTSKEARVFEGVDEEEELVRQENLDFFERQVWSVQGDGTHVFPQLGNVWSELDDLEISWRIGLSRAFRDAPFEQDFDFIDEGDGFRLEEAESNLTTFSKIEDENFNWGVDVALPFSLGFILPGDGDAEISAGYAFLDSERDTFQRLFQFTDDAGGGFAISELFQRVDFFFDEANIGADGLLLEDIGGLLFPEGFEGSLEIDQWYVKGEIQLTPFLSVSGGIRSEESLQIADTFTLASIVSGAPEAIDQAILGDFLLPSVTATWNFASNLQLRVGFSQTITRPQFRELAAQQFINNETDVNFFGNPFLTNTEIDNYDARLEYYFGPGEFFTVGGFFKDLTNPIEQISFLLADSDIASFANAPSAELWGIELELEKNLNFQDWFGWQFLGDREFKLGGNYTYSQSDVSSDGTVTLIDAGQVPNAVPVEFAGPGVIIDGRALQGQSDHIANIQFGFDNPDAGSRFRIIMNYVSERIRTTENVSTGTPAIIEQVPLTVDLSYIKEFNWRDNFYTLTLRAQNITGDDYIAFSEGTVNVLTVDSFDRGANFSIGLAAAF